MINLVDVLDDCVQEIEKYSNKVNKQQQPSPQEASDLLTKLVQLKAAAQSDPGQEVPDIAMKMIAGPYRVLLLGIFADVLLDMYNLRPLLQQVTGAQQANPKPN